MAHGLAIFPNGTSIDLPPGIVSLTQLENLVRDQSKNFLYSAVAMFTLVFYDYLITLNMEAKYIWGSKNRISLTNVLFVLNRYLPLFRAFGFLIFSLRPPHDDQLCSDLTDVNSYATMLNVAIVEILMLLRTYALWGKNKPIGFVLLSVWCAAIITCVVTVRSNLQPIPGVIPLAPLAISPCDRPSPFKYMVTYCAALVVELTTLVFMMGRIIHLNLKSKARSHRNPQRSMALPLIQGLQKHGTAYFIAVIFVMTFTVVSSFSERLARIVVNAGFAPTITSIACNRVIFTLRGLYFDVTVGDSGDTFRSPTGQRPRTISYSIHGGMRGKPGLDDMSQGGARRTRMSQAQRKQADGSYEYDDEVAITRNDVDTKDLTATTDYQMQYRDRESRRNVEPTSADAETLVVPQSRRVTFPTPQLKAPFHAHGMSSSTAMTSDDSLVQGRSQLVDEEELAETPTADSFRGRGTGRNYVPRGSSKSSFGFPPGPGSATSNTLPGVRPSGSPMSRTTASPILSIRPGHAIGAGSTKRSLSSLSGIIRPSTTRDELNSAAPDGAEEISPTSPPRSTQGLVERFGSMWKRKDGREGSVKGYYDGGANQDSFGEESGRERTRTRERERDRHPLDHHYEMETIHSDLAHEQQWSLGELEGEEPEDVARQAPPMRGTSTAGRFAPSAGATPGETAYISRVRDQSLHDRQ